MCVRDSLIRVRDSFMWAQSCGHSADQHLWYIYTVRDLFLCVRDSFVCGACDSFMCVCDALSLAETLQTNTYGTYVQFVTRLCVFVGHLCVFVTHL